METIVFNILQIFFATRADLKTGEYFLDIPQLGNIWSRDVFRPIARKRRYLMDYNLGYSPGLAGEYSVT